MHWEYGTYRRHLYHHNQDTPHNQRMPIKGTIDNLGVKQELTMKYQISPWQTYFSMKKFMNVYHSEISVTSFMKFLIINKKVNLRDRSCRNFKHELDISPLVIGRQAYHGSKDNLLPVTPTPLHTLNPAQPNFIIHEHSNTLVHVTLFNYKLKSLF